MSEFDSLSLGLLVSFFCPAIVSFRFVSFDPSTSHAHHTSDRIARRTDRVMIYLVGVVLTVVCRLFRLLLHTPYTIHQFLPPGWLDRVVFLCLFVVERRTAPFLPSVGHKG